MPEFLAETYAPGTAAPGADDLALTADQLSRRGAPVRFLGAVVVPDEETCFCLYQAPSAATVREAMTRAGLRPDRITRAVTIRPPRTRPGPAPGAQATPRPPAPSPDPLGTSARPPQFPASTSSGRQHDVPASTHSPPGQARPQISTSRTVKPRPRYPPPAIPLSPGARPCPQPPDHRSPARTARLPTTWPGRQIRRLGAGVGQFVGGFSLAQIPGSCEARLLLSAGYLWLPG